MSDYSKTTNFTAKDSLPSGNPSKLIKGSEFDTEFDALETAVATKANKIGSPVENDLILQASDGDIKVAGWGFPNVNADVTASDEELNILDGVTATTAELNILDGITATTAELNILDGFVADYGSVSFPSTASLASNTQTIALSNVSTPYGVMMLVEDWITGAYRAITSDSMYFPIDLGGYLVGSGTIPSAGNVNFEFKNTSGSAQTSSLRYVIWGTA